MNKIRKRIKYYVNTGGKWIKDSEGGRNFKIFTNKKAALRYFKSNPHRQLDIRGRDKRNRVVRYCWKFWDHGKVITQKRLG